VFSDLALYDIKNRRWIGLSQVNANKRVNIGKRCMHTVTTVISPKIDSKVRFFSNDFLDC
jgi:hypothetical protein